VFEIGNSLREARHRQQLELSEVEQATKIRSRYLKALEEEAFDALPAQTYVKGFLRTYADYLGLDGQLYVDEFNSRYSDGGEEPREPVVARRSAGVPSPHHRLERRGVLIALAGIGVLVGLFFAAFRFGGHDNPSSQIPNLGPSPGTTTHTKTKQKTHRAVVAARPSKFRFFVVATGGDCWMEVRNYSANGRTLYAGTLQLHQFQRFVARRLWIDFGSPGNVRASVNGRAVTIPGGGRTVAVQVTRQGVSLAPKTG
jgi:cytoskeleton protein RodZ